MTKLAELVSEDTSFAEKMKINARRFGLAGVGLLSLVEHERDRLYKQILEMGESVGGSDTLVGRISLISTGTLNLMREETLRVFDELVEEGEQAWSKDKKTTLLGVEKISATRTVGRSKNSTADLKRSVSSKAATVADAALQSAAGLKADSESVMKRTASKAAVVKAKAKAAYDELSDEMKQRFDEVKVLATDLSGYGEQAKLEINALVKQIKEGDVKGRRPAQSKVQECAEFDARKAIKGMKPSEALQRLEKVLAQNAEEVAH
ncbi:acyl-CoA-binding protein [Ketobacter sp. MCCC 1A13808]|uniref:acyl-CoA-binding protein n=1 Tax=Ketobacter sp. MCCC 1A13808 TaxID=2602738 RepID=UPI000F2D7A9F|nr:acyl-CoA-binding protein [Ketobacter sp. MCCC 1A13808]MVF12788.1 acyl-CoA-binding protein [Ketobacter sp. MCCC 1A13808]RLP54536.1 MAG: hypothetical protein D6160_10955 [Ketobacter sp.]